MTHRRTPSRSALVLPGWFFIVSAGISLAAALWLAVVVVDDLRSDDSSEASAPAPSHSTSAGPSPTPSATKASPSPTRAKPSRSPKPKRTPKVDRASVRVDVFNGTRVTGLARRGSASVQQRGWTVGAVGNWRGGVAATTVFYPQGKQAEARQLAKDLGGVAVAPAVSGMSGDRLTVVLLSVR